MKKKKRLKKYEEGEDIIEHHIALDQCPEDFVVDVFHPYYMPPRIVIKKKQKNYEKVKLN